MTPKCIVYNSPRDGVVVIHPALNARLEGESEADFLARVWARNVETAAQPILRGENRGQPFNPHLKADTPHFIVEATEVPKREQRAAWFADLAKK